MAAKSGWNTKLTQPIRLSLQDLAILRETLLARRDAYRAAIQPFGLITTWEATNRLDHVIDLVIEARCNLKRRQHPDYNPAGDSECEGYATDEELDRWRAEHPLPDEPAAPDAQEPGS